MREEAKLQLLQTQMWYDERNVGLGDAFLHHVGKVIERIVMYPLQFPDAYNGHRAAYVRKFLMWGHTILQKKSSIFMLLCIRRGWSRGDFLNKFYD